MSKSYRVRTDIGQDKKVTFELKQDFDLLEILSLSLSQKDVYTRMCSDFGVVVGRVVVNNGYGVPNCKVSIFVPLDDEDEDNEIISQLYPYKQPFDKNDDGIRYNLLSSDPTFDCHVAVGSFPKISDVLRSKDVDYVYKKYYRYTARTNQAGDFMIYGVPIGEQQVIMDVDLSDIGCFSFLPQDFKEKGYPESDFDGPRFRKDIEIDSLPQIVNSQQTINVSPFWGDEDQCQASISRVDFDLGNSGVKIEPLSVFMGSTATDTGKDSINKYCTPRKHQGELCKLKTKKGIIDCIRYTPFFTEDDKAYGGGGGPFGGTVPVLERFYFNDGGKVIDEHGAFLVHVPMNLDHVITDEFGKLTLSNDPTKGVATRSRVRFRVRPEQAEGGARKRRIGSYLIPNVREFFTENNNNGDWPGIDRRSYSFSIKYSDYHPYAQESLIPAGKDFFYDMLFNRVYSPAQFHDHVKDTALFGSSRRFLGIKQIIPESKDQCFDNAMPFPVNNSVRMFKWSILLSDILITLMAMLYAFLTVMVSYIALILGVIMTPILTVVIFVCKFWCKLWEKVIKFSLGWPFYATWTIVRFSSFIPTPPKICAALTLTGQKCAEECQFFGLKIGFVLFSLRQKKYPDCVKCACRESASSELGTLGANFLCPGEPPDDGETTTTGSPCPVGNAVNSNTAAGNWEHDCCEGPGLGELCCPDTYGFDSDKPYWLPTHTSPQMDGLAAGGCYVKVICINPKCFLFNMHLRIVREWMRRQKIVAALCKGLMNYFWENNWVTGFLYQFQFKAKLIHSNNYQVPNPPNAADADPRAFSITGKYHETYATNSKYCKKVVFLHPTEHTFYYRSAPFRASTEKFIGDDDGIKGGNGSDNEHASGDMARHILFPTTITDMGSRNQCIQQICYDSKFGEECSVTDQIGSTSFQNIGDLISDVYDLKMDYPFTIRKTLFNRPSKNMGGDVGQILMQNSMVGVVGYQTNMANTDCDCDPGAPSTDTSIVPIYPEVNFDPDPASYVPNALNVMSGEYNIGWAPLTYTASSQTIMTGQDLIDCLTDELNLSSQIIPYYMWQYTKSSGSYSPKDEFGGLYNDWNGRVGIYNYTKQLDGVGMQIVGVTKTISDGSHADDSNILNATPTSGGGQPDLRVGNFQYDMASNATGGNGLAPALLANKDHYPPLTVVKKSPVVFSQGLFYYFGVRPANTSFNTFVRMYINEELADTVI